MWNIPLGCDWQHSLCLTSVVDRVAVNLLSVSFRREINQLWQFLTVWFWIFLMCRIVIQFKVSMNFFTLKRYIEAHISLHELRLFFNWAENEKCLLENRKYILENITSLSKFLSEPVWRLLYDYVMCFAGLLMPPRFEEKNVFLISPLKLEANHDNTVCNRSAGEEQRKPVNAANEALFENMWSEVKVRYKDKPQ